jgi:hypothetical protein
MTPQFVAVAANEQNKHISPSLYTAKPSPRLPKKGRMSVEPAINIDNGVLANGTRHLSSICANLRDIERQSFKGRGGVRGCISIAGPTERGLQQRLDWLGEEAGYSTQRGVVGEGLRRAVARLVHI